MKYVVDTITENDDAGIYEIKKEKNTFIVIYYHEAGSENSYTYRVLERISHNKVIKHIEVLTYHTEERVKPESVMDFYYNH